MAPKKRAKREYGTGSIYQNENGSYTAALRVNGQLIRKTAPSRETAEAIITELLKGQEIAKEHISRLEGLQFVMELWYHKLPPELKERYRTMFDARLLPILEDLKKLDAENVDIAEHAQLVEDWLNAWFDEICIARTLKPRTIAFYRDTIQGYLLPALTGIRLYQMRATGIQQIINDIRAEIATASEDRYSGVRTARAAFGVLRDAFNLAVDRGYLIRHPCNGVILPTTETAAVHPLADDELQRFFAVASAARHPALWYLYGQLGVRRGEGLAVMWSSIDWEARTIRIDKQVQLIDSKLVLAPPKTAGSKRTLPLPDLSYRALWAMWEALEDKHTGLIFCTRDKTPLWPRNTNDDFYQLRERAGIADTVTLHHLRHTVSTLLDEMGASEAIKAGILGHGKKGVTQRYTHARIETMRSALAAVEGRVPSLVLSGS